MFNFEFYNPTKILFGKGQIASIAKEVPAGAKVLLTAGGGSIKANGVYQQTIDALAGRTIVEFWGIEPNPEYATLMKAVELARREKIDFILAVGGGSVLDGSKFIAAAIPFEGEPWDIMNKSAVVESATALASILTLPATGSESNTFAVISRRETGEKLAFGSVHVYPKFAVLDPETTFSLPPRQVSNGVVDAFCHVCEQYMTFPADAQIQDRFAESILKTLIEVGPRTLANPTNYDDRATFVWSATLALNGLIGAGVPQDWSTHMIGHELTALYNIDHARTLAVVMPHLFRVQSAQKEGKLVQFAERVWGITSGSTAERIEAAVVKTEEFFESMGLPTRLSRYENIQPETPSLVAEKLKGRGFAKLGEKGEVGPEQVVEILTRSLAA
jgi:NADP-dependent alcohol dehydrogenase